MNGSVQVMCYISRLDIVALLLCQHDSRENYDDDNIGGEHRCYYHHCHHQRIRFEPVLTSNLFRLLICWFLFELSLYSYIGDLPIEKCSHACICVFCCSI